MFSVSKSLTALAVGCLAGQGALGLGDSVAQYFPDLAPSAPHPWLAACTVRDLLCMQSCHRATTYKQDLAAHWVGSFFATPPTKPPGTMFHYDTSATHVLAALVERRSGQPLLAYLRKVCLDELGWSAGAKILTDPFGTAQGGTGLVCTAEDLLRLGVLLIDDGRWRGKQLLPAGFVAEATSALVPTAGWATCPEEAMGYGYGFWQVGDGGFGAVGKGGQLLLCWPRQQLVVVATADTQWVPGGHNLLQKCIRDSLLPALDGDPGAAADMDALQDYCENAALRPVAGVRRAGALSTLAGRYRVSQPAAFTALEWQFGDESNSLTLWQDATPRRFAFRFGAVLPGQSPFDGGPCAASAGWKSEKELLIQVHLLGDDCAGIRLRAAFYPGGCALEMDNTCEPRLESMAGILTAEREEG